MTLEEKIKMLMEAKQGEDTLSEESIEELEEAKVKVEKDGTIEADSDDDKEEDKSEDQEDDQDESDEDTEMSQDAGETKKNKVDVKEGTDPFGKLDSNGGDSAGDAGKNAKLKSGLGRKDDAGQGKLADTASADKSDDNGDNARLKAGLDKKETAGKATGPSAGGSENPENAKNNVEKNPAGVKEHMTALFSGEELSEEFQAKAATIFEAAVEQVAAARIEALQEEYAQEIVRLQEEQQQQVEEAVEQVRDELVEQVDGFLNLVVEQWIEENQVALESGMKVELVNGFIDGLKTLFKENYVDIPEEKLDVIEEQAAEISALSEGNGKLVEQVSDLEAELASLKSALVFESVADDLTDMQAEKFKELVENVEFTTVEEYEQKLQTLKESYFPAGQSKPTSIETISESTEHVVTNMDTYVQAVAQNLKFR